MVSKITILSKQLSECNTQKTQSSMFSLKPFEIVWNVIDQKRAKKKKN